MFDRVNKMKHNKKKNTGSLPEHQNVPYRDYRGRDNSVNKTHEPKAPDGVAGDWR